MTGRASPSPGGGRPPYRLLATAGHVDHGKSTLVRALTGIDPDRFVEEKERGLSIDLGFAHLALPSGATIGIVDVPGHARFLKNMVAGVGSVDACIFVVSAKEGWQAQSEEHLAVLELLGVRKGIVVLSHFDVVDDETLVRRVSEVRARLGQSTLAGEPILPVDSLSGRGITQLTEALESLVRRTDPSPDRGRPRLFVDRSFTLKGAGTVVTGTLSGGALGLDDEISVVPGPGPSFRPHPVRLRRLQVHGEDRDLVFPGERLAANLTGIEASDLRRGQALVRPGQWEPTTVFDASLRILRGAPALRSRGNHHLHIGTAHSVVSLRLIGGEEICPGYEGKVRVRLKEPLPLLPGDLFLLRDGGRAETIGGGEVLDVAPVLPAKRARPDRSVDRVLAERGFLEAGVLERLTGERRTPDVGDYVVDPRLREERQGELLERLGEAGSLGLAAAELDGLDRALADSLPAVDLRVGRYRLGATKEQAAHPYVEASRSSPLNPPEVGPHSRAELRDLARQGILVDCEGLFLLPEALERAESALASELSADGVGVTVSRLRQRLGTSRKVTLVILSHFDTVGITRREGDRRVAGPVLERKLEGLERSR